MVDVTSDRRTAAPHWLDAAQQRAWRAYLDGNQQLLGRLNGALQTSDAVSLAEYRILVMLSETPGGALRMSELADGILSSRSRLTHQIRRMEQQGMVRRVSCSSDGRGVLARITETGMRRLRVAAPGHVADVRRYFIDLMTPEQLETIAEVFERIQQAVGGELQQFEDADRRENT